MEQAFSYINMVAQGGAVPGKTKGTPRTSTTRPAGGSESARRENPRGAAIAFALQMAWMVTGRNLERGACTGKSSRDAIRVLKGVQIPTSHLTPPGGDASATGNPSLNNCNESGVRFTVTVIQVLRTSGIRLKELSIRAESLGTRLGRPFCSVR